MTVSELFDFIKGVRPGFAFTDAQMMVWLNEIEGKVQTDILLLEPSVSEDGKTTGFIEYDATIDPETGKMVDAETELIVKFPWNKLYRYFMLMSIDLYNGEYQRYANTFALFNEAYEEYSAWVAQNIAPANGNAVAHGYYLTAYQCAVNGGYTGTAHDFDVLLASYAGTAEAVRDERERAEEAAELSERWATGNAGGTPSATNNSKYYAKQARAVYGAPLTAATAAAMTDTTRVYVYTGDEEGYVFGDWYYHDGAEWTVGGVYNSIAIQTDKTLSQTDQAADAAAVRAAFEYEPVAINTFAITVPAGGLAELGSTVTAVTLGYALNKTLAAPETLTLSDGGEPVSVIDDPSPIELTELEVTSETTYTLAATDAGSPIHSAATASKTAKLQFVNRVCWGAAANGTVDSAFVNALSNKVLSATKARTFTVNAGSGQYIWYCVPTRLGTCRFKVGDFEGGFEAPQTVSVTNASGFAENYYVYKSANANLGSTTVVVS